jgi:hypothetical protein
MDWKVVDGVLTYYSSKHEATCVLIRPSTSGSSGEIDSETEGLLSTPWSTLRIFRSENLPFMAWWLSRLCGWNESDSPKKSTLGRLGVVVAGFRPSFLASLPAISIELSELSFFPREHTAFLASFHDSAPVQRRGVTCASNGHMYYPLHLSHISSSPYGMPGMLWSVASPASLLCTRHTSAP